MELVGARLAGAGERRGIDWLTYNPLQIHAYHVAARADAPAVAGVLDGEFPAPQRFLDVGSGSGALVAALTARGRQAVGCERSRAGRLMTRAQGARSIPFDLTRHPAAQAPHAEVACSFEVAEHLPPPLAERLVDFLVDRSSRWIAFSAAVPDQGGLGHINEQPVSHWVGQFEKRGAAFRDRLTTDVRERMRTSGVQAPWFSSSMIILELCGDAQAPGPGRG